MHGGVLHFCYCSGDESLQKSGKQYDLGFRLQQYVKCVPLSKVFCSYLQK